MRSFSFTASALNYPPLLLLLDHGGGEIKNKATLRTNKQPTLSQHGSWSLLIILKHTHCVRKYESWVGRRHVRPHGIHAPSNHFRLSSVTSQILVHIHLIAPSSLALLFSPAGTFPAAPPAPRRVCVRARIAEETLVLQEGKDGPCAPAPVVQALRISPSPLPSTRTIHYLHHRIRVTQYTYSTVLPSTRTALPSTRTAQYYLAHVQYYSTRTALPSTRTVQYFLAHVQYYPVHVQYSTCMWHSPV